MARKFAQLRAEMSPERQKRVKARAESLLQEMALAELRRARQMS